MTQLSALDDAGMAVWASKRLVKSPRFWAPSGDSGPVVFLDFEHPRSAHWRILDRAVQTDRAVHVALSHDPDPALAEVYLATDSTRARLLEMGFQETPVEAAVARPEGLRQAERLLFRSRVEPVRGAITVAAGLAIRGAPQGEGVARVLAREARERLTAGVAPEEILIVYRHWTDEAELALEMLRAWGLPAHAEIAGPLQGEPAAAALRLAASIPLHDWETELIIRLLRHGQFRPAWPGADRLGLARAASTIKATGVFRGSAQLLGSLDRSHGPARQAEAKVRDLQAARVIAERLIKRAGSARSVPALERPGRRAAQGCSSSWVWMARRGRRSRASGTVSTTKATCSIGCHVVMSPGVGPHSHRRLMRSSGRSRSCRPSHVGSVRLTTVDQAEGRGPGT